MAYIKKENKIKNLNSKIKFFSRMLKNKIIIIGLNKIKYKCVFGD